MARKQKSSTFDFDSDDNSAVEEKPLPEKPIVEEKPLPKVEEPTIEIQGGADEPDPFDLANQPKKKKKGKKSTVPSWKKEVVVKGMVAKNTGDAKPKAKSKHARLDMAAMRKAAMGDGAAPKKDDNFGMM